MGSSARTCGAEDNALSNALRTVPAPPVLRVTRGTAPNWHLWCSLTLFALVVWDGILPRLSISEVDVILDPARVRLVTSTVEKKRGENFRSRCHIRLFFRSQCHIRLVATVITSDPCQSL